MFGSLITIVTLALVFTTISIEAMHIVAISGSLRKASCNTGVLRAMAKMLPAGHTMDIIIPGELPLFNQDLELPEVYPQTVKDFRGRLRAADCFLFGLSEYNFSMSGILHAISPCKCVVAVLKLCSLVKAL
jgi:hypothetical protein